MRIPVAFTLILLATTSFAAGVSLRPEIALGSPAREPAESNDLSIASSGTEAFAVWSNALHQAVGTQISTDGSLLDPFGRILSPARPAAHQAIAWNGNAYVLLFLSYQPSGTCCAGSTMLLERDGTVRRGAVEFGPAQNPTVAANGTRVLLLNLQGQTISFLQDDGSTRGIGHLPPKTTETVIVTRKDGFGVYAFEPSSGSKGLLHQIQVDNEGRITDVVVDQWPNQNRFAAVSHGDEDLVVWSAFEPGVVQNTTHARTRCELFGPDGLRRNAVALLSNGPDAGAYPQPPPGPSVIWDGNQFAVAYFEYYLDARFGIVTMQVAPDGTPSQSRTVIADMFTQIYPQSVFAVVGTRPLLGWRFHQQAVKLAFPTTRFRFLDSLEAITGPGEVLAGTPAPQGQPAISSDGKTIAVAWSESQWTRRIVCQVASVRGELSPAVTLSSSGDDSVDPAVTSGGGMHLVAWRELQWTSGHGKVTGYRVRAQRIAADGSLVHLFPIELDRGTQTVPYAATRSVDVAWDGSNFVIAWIGGDGRPMIQRLTTGGVAVDFAPQAMGRGDYRTLGIGLAGTGDGVMAAYLAQHDLKWPNVMSLQTVRAGTNGPPGESLIVVPANGTLSLTNMPEAAWNGSHLALAWQQVGSATEPPRNVATLFDKNGVSSTGIKKLGGALTTDSAPPVGKLVGDRGFFWHLARSESGVPVAQKLDGSLEPVGKPIEIAPWGEGVSDGAGAILGGALAVAYPRLDPSGPTLPVQRVFLQWIFTTPRQRAAGR